MNNLSSYCGLVDAKIRASDKDLPVHFVIRFDLSAATTLKSLIEEQTGINEQAWKKVPPCLLIY